MVIVAGHVTVEPQERESDIAGCVRVVEQGRAAVGCLDLAVTADLIDPGRVNVIERWESQEALGALAATGDVEPHESGPASGVLNTAFMMGGALDPAALVAVSDARSVALLTGGADPVTALNGGLHAAFLVATLATLAAAAFGRRPPTLRAGDRHRHLNRPRLTISRELT